MSKRYATIEVAKEALNLLDNLEIVKGIGELGVENKKITELALKASKDSAAKTNPRLASISELEQLILECLDRAR